jgi:hypothetical protein
MAKEVSPYASTLRQELRARNRRYALGRVHAESYGGAPVIVYAPEDGRHGNFFDPAYCAITERPEWMRRFDKIHAQAVRSLPRTERRWRELDSSMSSDALLMNVFCAPGVLESTAVQKMMGVNGDKAPVFGLRARVPFANGRFDRTEVDMQWGELLVEAKLTESDFQTCQENVIEAYRDLDDVFDREMLPTVEISVGRRRLETEFPEDYSQVEILGDEDCGRTVVELPRESITGYESYQLIRNVLAAHALGASFCVIHDVRRPDLREAWYRVMSAVRSAELRTRLKVLTWQELAAALSDDLQAFLDLKYGIVAPGKVVSSAGTMDVENV